MLDKRKMEEAQQLIKAKRYEEARKLLVTVDHPKASEWLAKIDRIAPPRKQAPNQQLWWIFAMLVIGGAAIVIVLVFQSSQATKQTTRLEVALYTYCVGEGVSRSTCEVWARDTVDQSRLNVESCDEIAKGDDFIFKDCLTRMGLTP